MTGRMGFHAATGLVVVGVAYAVAVGFGIAGAGLVEPIVGPALAAMEVITFAAALLVVVLFAAVYERAAEAQRTAGLVALSFGVLMAGVTSGVHFVTLTAGRQTGFAALEWPSTLYALELLAWDVFLGLGLLFAAPVFVGRGLNAVARWLLVATGTLCLVGTIGPVLGDMALQRIGILGYGVALPITSGVLAAVFRRDARPDPASTPGLAAPPVHPDRPDAGPSRAR